MRGSAIKLTSSQECEKATAPPYAHSGEGQAGDLSSPLPLVREEKPLLETP